MKESDVVDIPKEEIKLTGKNECENGKSRSRIY